jgi:hypothetical protein
VGGRRAPHLDKPLRLVVATTDPARLPARTTWSLLTNLPRRGTRHGHAAADLAEVVRLYGLRTWVEQGSKQVKQELGWADFQVRSDRGIRRHLTLVCCAFSFCWQAQRTPDAHPPTHDTPDNDGGGPSTQGASRPHAARWAPACSWPIALRRVRSWLTPWRWLRRLWRAWSTSPPPPPVQAMLDWVTAGGPLYLYVPT